MEQNSAKFFRNERKRLNFTQQNLANKLEVSDMTIKRWETGTAIPSDKLSLLSQLGFDVIYILTGERQQNVQENAEVANYRVDCGEKPIEPVKINTMLNTSELIEHWHKLNDDDKETVLRLIKSLAKGSE